MKARVQNTSTSRPALANRTKARTTQQGVLRLTLHLSALAVWACIMQAMAADFPTTLGGYNPVLYWKLDEAAASPAPNTTANSCTRAPIGKGYIVGAVTNGESGVVGTSFRFSNPGQAVGNVFTKVEIQWDAALNPSPPFSIEFWAKPAALGADATGYCPVQ